MRVGTVSGVNTTPKPQSPAPTIGAAHLPLRDQVRNLLRDRIVAGELAPGTRIIEREVAAEFGVSRIPIREGLRALESEGFVSVVPRRGLVVSSLSRHDLDELFDVREALEVLSVRRATERAQPEELDTLRSVLEQARTALEESDRARTGRCNQQFHDTIILMAHNDLLAGILKPLEGRLHWLLRQNEDPERLYQEHEQIYMAIASGDPEAAARVALAHVVTSREICLELLSGARNEMPRTAPVGTQ